MVFYSIIIFLVSFYNKLCLRYYGFLLDKVIEIHDNFSFFRLLGRIIPGNFSDVNVRPKAGINQYNYWMTFEKHPTTWVGRIQNLFNDEWWAEYIVGPLGAWFPSLSFWRLVEHFIMLPIIWVLRAIGWFFDRFYSWALMDNEYVILNYISNLLGGITLFESCLTVMVYGSCIYLVLFFIYFVIKSICVILWQIITFPINCYRLVTDKSHKSYIEFYEEVYDEMYGIGNEYLGSLRYANYNLKRDFIRWVIFSYYKLDLHKEFTHEEIALLARDYYHWFRFSYIGNYRMQAMADKIKPKGFVTMAEEMSEMVVPTRGLVSDAPIDQKRPEDSRKVGQRTMSDPQEEPREAQEVLDDEEELDDEPPIERTYDEREEEAVAARERARKKKAEAKKKQIYKESYKSMYVFEPDPEVERDRLRMVESLNAYGAKKYKEWQDSNKHLNKSEPGKSMYSQTPGFFERMYVLGEQLSGNYTKNLGVVSKEKKEGGQRVITFPTYVELVRILEYDYKTERWIWCLYPVDDLIDTFGVEVVLRLALTSKMALNKKKQTLPIFVLRCWAFIFGWIIMFLQMIFRVSFDEILFRNTFYLGVATTSELYVVVDEPISEWYVFRFFYKRFAGRLFYLPFARRYMRILFPFFYVVREFGYNTGLTRAWVGMYSQFCRDILDLIHIIYAVLFVNSSTEALKTSIYFYLDCTKRLWFPFYSKYCRAKSSLNELGITRQNRFYKSRFCWRLFLVYVEVLDVYLSQCTLYFIDLYVYTYKELFRPRFIRVKDYCFYTWWRDILSIYTIMFEVSVLLPFYYACIWLWKHREHIAYIVLVLILSRPSLYRLYNWLTQTYVCLCLKFLDLLALAWLDFFSQAYIYVNLFLFGIRWKKKHVELRHDYRKSKRQYIVLKAYWRHKGFRKCRRYFKIFSIFVVHRITGVPRDYLDYSWDLFYLTLEELYERVMLGILMWESVAIQLGVSKYSEKPLYALEKWFYYRVWLFILDRYYRRYTIIEELNLDDFLNIDDELNMYEWEWDYAYEEFDEDNEDYSDYGDPYYQDEWLKALNMRLDEDLFNRVIWHDGYSMDDMAAYSAFWFYDHRDTSGMFSISYCEEVYLDYKMVVFSESSMLKKYNYPRRVKKLKKNLQLLYREMYDLKLIRLIELPTFEEYMQWDVEREKPDRKEVRIKTENLFKEYALHLMDVVELNEVDTLDLFTADGEKAFDLPDSLISNNLMFYDKIDPYTDFEDIYQYNNQTAEKGYSSKEWLLFNKQRNADFESKFLYNRLDSMFSDLPSNNFIDTNEEDDEYCDSDDFDTNYLFAEGLDSNNAVVDMNLFHADYWEAHHLDDFLDWERISLVEDGWDFVGVTEEPMDPLSVFDPDHGWLGIYYFFPTDFHAEFYYDVSWYALTKRALDYREENPYNIWDIRDSYTKDTMIAYTEPLYWLRGGATDLLYLGEQRYFFRHYALMKTQTKPTTSVVRRWNDERYRARGRIPAHAAMQSYNDALLALSQESEMPSFYQKHGYFRYYNGVVEFILRNILVLPLVYIYCSLVNAFIVPNLYEFMVNIVGIFPTPESFYDLVDNKHNVWLHKQGIFEGQHARYRKLVVHRHRGPLFEMIGLGVVDLNYVSVLCFKAWFFLHVLCLASRFYADVYRCFKDYYLGLIGGMLYSQLVYGTHDAVYYPRGCGEVGRYDIFMSQMYTLDEQIGLMEFMSYYPRKINIYHNFYIDFPFWGHIDRSFSLMYHVDADNTDEVEDEDLYEEYWDLDLYSNVYIQKERVSIVFSRFCADIYYFLNFIFDILWYWIVRWKDGYSVLPYVRGQITIYFEDIWFRLVYYFFKEDFYVKYAGAKNFFKVIKQKRAPVDPAALRKVLHGDQHFYDASTSVDFVSQGALINEVFSNIVINMEQRMWIRYYLFEQTSALMQEILSFYYVNHPVIYYAYIAFFGVFGVMLLFVYFNFFCVLLVCGAICYVIAFAIFYLKLWIVFCIFVLCAIIWIVLTIIYMPFYLYFRAIEFLHSLGLTDYRIISLVIRSTLKRIDISRIGTTDFYIKPVKYWSPIIYEWVATYVLWFLANLAEVVTYAITNQWSYITSYMLVYSVYTVLFAIVLLVWLCRLIWLNRYFIRLRQRFFQQ